MDQESLVTKLGKAIDEYRAERKQAVSNALEDSGSSEQHSAGIRKWLPSRGNVLFTLVMIGVLLWAQSAGAVPFSATGAESTGTIAYQGRLADSVGNPLTSTLNMTFQLYAASTGGAPLWTEQWTGSNSVQVSDGLFNVMLGSLSPISQSVIAGNGNLFLGITVGTDDEMSPRVQLGSVPFAMQALTVPDGSITKAKLAADINLTAPDGSITTEKIADFAIDSSKVLTDSLTISNTNFLVGIATIKGPADGCEGYGGETHCLKDVMVTHNLGHTNYIVVVGTHHGVFAQRHTVSIHSRTSNTFYIRATNIVNNFWSASDEVLVHWLLIPIQEP